MGKLLKHEYRYYAPIALALFITIIAGEIVQGFASVISNKVCFYDYTNEVFVGSPVLSAMLSILATCLVLGLVATLPLAVGIALYRYKKSLFSDEGYLTLVLPVKNETILYAKMLSGFLFIGAVCIVFAVSQELMESVLYSIFDVPTFTILDMIDDPEYIQTEIVGFILTVVSAVFVVCMLYAVITFASLKLKRARFLVGSVIAFALFILYQVITSYLESYVTESLLWTSVIHVAVSLFAAALTIVYSRHLLTEELNIE